jgi:hypothetical protein
VTLQTPFISAEQSRRCGDGSAELREGVEDLDWSCRRTGVNCGFSELFGLFQCRHENGTALCVN